MHIVDRGTEEDTWIQQALAALGRAILADKAEAAQRHYTAFDSPPLLYENATSPTRRRSSAIRSAALFQKFKDFAEAEVEDGALHIFRLHFVINLVVLTHNVLLLVSHNKGCCEK